MALNIKSNRVSQLANELAQETGETITEAVGKAVEERLAHLHRSAQRKGLAQRLMETGRKCKAQASQTVQGREWLARDYDAELYDEHGLPR